MMTSEFFTSCGVLIVAGKGGVGKTTVAATLATAAARNGAATLLVEVDGKHQLAALFECQPLQYTPTPIDVNGSGSLHAIRLTPDRALTDYLNHRGIYRALKRIQGDKVLDALATATPGVKDLLVLGKIQQMDEQNEYDLIVVDAPASGHAISLLRSAAGVADSVDTGPLHEQAVLVRDMLSDEDRCQIVLVTLAEETPVTEVIEAAYRLEDEIGITLGPLVANALTADAPDSPVDAQLVDLAPDLAESLRLATAFQQNRVVVRDQQLTRLDTELPLPRIHLPAIEDTPLGRTELDQLVEVLESEIDELGSSS